MPKLKQLGAREGSRDATARLACIVALAAGALLQPAAALAQTTPLPQQRVLSLGTFLTQDGGWNYALGLAFDAAVERDLGTRLRVSAGAAALTAPLAAMGGEAAIYPPYPDGLEHALALRVQIRTQSRGAGVYALAGLEGIAGHAGNQGGGVRGGASVGLGLSWRQRARSALEAQ